MSNNLLNSSYEYFNPWFKKQILDALEKNILDMGIYQQYPLLDNIINDFGMALLQIP